MNACRDAAGPAVAEPLDSPSMDEPRYGWVVVGGAFMSLAVIFGVAYSFAAFFASFAAEFDAHRADVSLVFGLCGLIYFVLGAGAGILADRFGPRAVCSVGVLFIAGGLFATSFAGAMTDIYLAYGVGIGIGVGLVYAPAIASVQPWFTRRRGLAGGIASAGIGAGTVVLPLIAAAAIAALDWRGALRALAVGVLVVGLAAARRDARRSAARPSFLVVLCLHAALGAGDVHSLRARLGRGARPRHR